MFNICIAHFTMEYDQMRITLFKKYHIKTKILKIKNTNAMIFRGLKRIKIVLIKNTKATIFTSSIIKENNNPKKLSY